MIKNLIEKIKAAQSKLIHFFDGSTPTIEEIAEDAFVEPGFRYI